MESESFLSVRKAFGRENVFLNAFWVLGFKEKYMEVPLSKTTLMGDTGKLTHKSCNV